jgi:hypothetical protein
VVIVLLLLSSPDPEFQPVLQDCQQPGRMMQHMHDPRYAPRLNFLISRGVFNVHA